MKEWKGMIEKDFTIVHYADMNVIDKKRFYYITLNSDGKNSAKTPPMFLDSEDQDRIENDYSLFISKVNKVLNNN